MTDKQIIIDGVDVSECKCFGKYQKIVRNNECIVDIQNACVEEIETKPCSQKHNCYFKNWQRKEQEFEELKKELKNKTEDLERHQNHLYELGQTILSLEKDLKTEQKDKQYIKKWCIEAGKELAKHSFAWDGKEKNLVIQAMELNERFAAKEQECEELKHKVNDKHNLLMQYVDNYDQLKAKNEELKKELQKYKDDEQQEKEMQKLYDKFKGNSLIEKSVTNEQRP